MKKLLLVLTLGVSLSGLAACSTSSNEVIVESKAGNITKEEFYTKLKDTNGKVVIEQMIQEKILRKEFKVSDKEINKEFNKVKDQFGSKEEFTAALESYGFKDEKTFKNQIELSLLQLKASTDGVKVTDKILKDYYDKNKKEFEYANASHILVESEAKANEIITKLNKGEDFAKLAKESSTDTGTASKGGELGEFKKGMMVPAFEEAAFSLELNQISKPVKSDFGYHIIKVSERGTKTFTEAKDEIKSTYLQKNAKPIEQILEQLNKKADVKVKDKKLEKALLEQPTQPAPSQQQQQPQQTQPQQ